MKNPEGKVVTTFEKTGSGGAPAGPATPEGHKVEEVDAPDDYMKDLQAFYNKHSGK